MKISKSVKALLLLSGAIGAGIGAAILLIPVAFHATTGIELGGNISLLNEVRAPGGALLALGVLVMLGAFASRLTFTSLVVASLLYLSYGAARVLSMVVDGMPASELVLVAGLEIVIGLACVFALLKHQKSDEALA